MVKTLLMAAVLGVNALAIAAEPGAGTGGAATLVAMENGGVRRGAGAVVFSNAGRMSVYVGTECLIQNASIGCGYKGYTTSDHFQNRKAQRAAGKYTYEGTLPGQAVKFTLQAVPEGEGVRVTIRREGAWPAEANWCAFQMQVPVSAYGGSTVEADGKAVTLPPEKHATTNILGGAKKLVLGGDDPRRRFEISSERGININDARAWNAPMYQISVGMETTGESAEASFLLRFPEGSPEQLQPRLCVAPMGYSAKGLREVTMEWPKGMPRPADGVRIEEAGGKTVAAGKFGPTLTLEHMQNAFASFAFAEVSTPGKYKVVWDGGAAREIEIKPTIFADAMWTPTLDVFLPWQMCHADITFAGGKRPNLPACHLDDAQRVPANFPGIDGFKSYEANLTPYKQGEMISCGTGGWHDAGDYDLNVHAQGYSTWKMALAYEEFGVDRDVTTLEVAKQRVVAGKGDGVPDLLQQVQWGAVWLLTMQQQDGLVYPGVCCRPGGQYTAAVLPEKLSDNTPGTKDERYLYVDYQPASQLAQVISLAGSAKALKKVDPVLAQKCIAAAEAAMVYYRTAPLVYRENTYFNKKAEDGKIGTEMAALAELYMATGKATYLTELEGRAGEIDQVKVSWPWAYSSHVGGWWYAPTVLARLAPKLEEGQLKSAIVRLCERAVKEQSSQSSNRPWPVQWFHVLDWGAAGHCLGRTFDAYYLEKVVPGQFTLAGTQREMQWMLGYHPLNDVAFVCSDDPNIASPKYLYNGRLHGRSGSAAASVPGAVVPGMGGVEGAGMVTYNDAHGNYYHNEACIYTAADYLFAVHALKAAGY